MVVNGRQWFRGAFAALVALALVASVVFPAWSQSLALHGYYADLVTTIRPLTAYRAGRPVELEVRVRNQGPDAVGAVDLVLSPDRFAPGWSVDPCVRWAQPTCRLGALLVGQTAVSFVRAMLRPDARGVATVGAYARSEARDTLLGNEIAVTGGAIEVASDLGVDADPPARLSSGEVEWTVWVTNHGPADAHAPTWRIEASGASVRCAQCLAGGSATSCPTASGTANLGVHGVWMLRFRASPASGDAPLHLRFEVSSSEGAIEGTAPNAVEASTNGTLLADGFE